MINWLILLERFSIERRLPESTQSQRPNRGKENIFKGQWEQSKKEETNSLKRGMTILIGFSFASDWLRAWRERNFLLPQFILITFRMIQSRLYIVPQGPSIVWSLSAYLPIYIPILVQATFSDVWTYVEGVTCLPYISRINLNKGSDVSNK